MNETSSPPPAGGHCGRLVLLGGRVLDRAQARRCRCAGRAASSTRLAPACANSLASVSGASSTDGSRNGRSRLQAGEDQRDRLRRLLRADADRAVVGELETLELGMGARRHLCELAVADRLAVPDQRRRVRLAVRLLGEVVGERFAHRDPWPACGAAARRDAARTRRPSPGRCRCAAARCRSSSPLKPAAISSAPTLGSVIALALTGQGVPVRERGLEHGAADVDVAGVALLVADVLVVDRDDAVLGVDHAAELVLVGDLDERGQPVAERASRSASAAPSSGRIWAVSRIADAPISLAAAIWRLARDEVLLQERQVGELRDVEQHLVVAAEPAAGHDRDAGGAGGGVLGDELRDRPLAHQLDAVGRPGA